MKRPYLWITLFSGAAFWSCAEEESSAESLLGSWNLSQHYYATFGNVDTTTYTEGELVYSFYDDQRLYIQSATQEMQTRHWELTEDGDSLFFDVGSPWALSDIADGTFTAQLEPYIDAYSTYVFVKAE